MENPRSQDKGQQESGDRTEWGDAHWDFEEAVARLAHLVLDHIATNPVIRRLLVFGVSVAASWLFSRER